MCAATIGICLRTTIVTALYKKSLRLSPAARADFSTGQIVNMMSTDANRLDSLMMTLNNLFSAGFLLVAIIALLINSMGPASLAGIVTVFFIGPLQRKLMGMAQVYRKDIAQATDKRVKFMNEMLQGIRVYVCV